MALPSPDDILDQLVAEYSDRLARGGEGDPSDLLARVPADRREGLHRCLKMVQAGIAKVPRSAAPLAAGRVLGGFRIERELGRGGMGVVYAAEQLGLARKVALKVLRPGLALEPRHVERFQREAQAIARLAHPHIVQVYAVGEEDGFHFIAMELVEGPSLADVLARLPRGERWTSATLARAAGIPALEGLGSTYERALCALLAPIARALGAAHARGLVHRDVKPSNVLIRADGRALVADFGLAKGEGDPGLSLTGEPLGTPYYMSPEQAALTAQPVDARSDVYSLGVTLYEALSGRRPFEGDSLLAVLEAIRRRAPAALRSVAPGVSRDAEAVVRRAMEHRSLDRYADGGELEGDLEALAVGRPTRARALQGGALRRSWRTMRLIGAGEIQEYRSQRTFLGLPLVHVYAGVRQPWGGGLRVARGWIAAGDVAVGAFAFGGLAFGLFSFGGLALGLLIGFGGLALGGFAYGGVAVGGLAFGGYALGHTALGGYAQGVYACGGRASGAHVLSHAVRDPEALEWFRGLRPLLHLIPGGSGVERLLGPP